MLSCSVLIGRQSILGGGAIILACSWQAGQSEDTSMDGWVVDTVYRVFAPGGGERSLLLWAVLDSMIPRQARQACEGASPMRAPCSSTKPELGEFLYLAEPSNSASKGGSGARDPAIQLQPPSMATGTGAKTTPPTIDKSDGNADDDMRVLPALWSDILGGLARPNPCRTVASAGPPQLT